MSAVPKQYQARGLNVRLSNEEKRELSRQAREAWQMLSRKGATDEREEEFRHRIALETSGRRVSEALRGDYNDLSAAFLAISGQTGRALKAAYKSGTADREIPLKKLTTLLQERGKDISYAGPVLWNMYKVALSEATAKQLWAVFYSFQGDNAQRTGRRKAYKARAKASPPKPAKPFTPEPPPRFY